MHVFRGNIDYSNILHVEIFILMHVIQICWEEGLKGIICYTNSMHTIHLVQNLDVSTHRYRTTTLARETPHSYRKH